MQSHFGCRTSLEASQIMSQTKGVEEFVVARMQGAQLLVFRLLAVAIGKIQAKVM